MVARTTSFPLSLDHASETATTPVDELARARARALARAQVDAAATGDVRAQRWLIEHVIADVRAVARALLREVHEADDAAQFALLQILRAAASFRGEASVRHWARCVATRAVLKHRAKLRTRSLGGDDELDALAAEGPARDEDELPRSLREYLAELPPEQAEALVLHHALGHSIPEIAELTALSPNTIKSRIRLGTQELRRRIRQDLLVGRRVPRGSER